MTAPDAKDDGGREQQSEPRGDDLIVRIPSKP